MQDKARGVGFDPVSYTHLENGMNEIHGPLYYNTLGKQGMLVEGFENIPPVSYTHLTVT